MNPITIIGSKDGSGVNEIKMHVNNISGINDASKSKTRKNCD